MAVDVQEDQVITDRVAQADPACCSQADIMLIRSWDLDASPVMTVAIYFCQLPSNNLDRDHVVNTPLAGQGLAYWSGSCPRQQFSAGFAAHH